MLEIIMAKNSSLHGVSAAIIRGTSVGIRTPRCYADLGGRLQLVMVLNLSKISLARANVMQTT